MLKFNQINLRRGSRELLHQVSCCIHTGQRIGVTGANGVGKSSLFAMINGTLQPDSGDISLPPNTTIAQVKQDTPASDKSALEYVMDGDQEFRLLQHDIVAAEQENDGNRLAHLYSHMEIIQGYSAASRAGKLMHGLGFTANQENIPVKEFSGGWRMRLNLAQALMCRSDLLLLDEPTNHLDLEAVIWLEDWLLSYPGTLMLISHDKEFLDRVVTHIAHIEHCSLDVYTGNYTEFEIRRAEQLAHQQSAYEKQQREIAHIQSYVNRFRAKATKARQAQSRIKALERMQLIAASHVDSPFHFQFKPCEKLPDQLLHLEKVRAGYGDKTVLNNVSINILAGNRIGLLGYNGAGKSTLIKLLAREIPATEGDFTAAKDINIGYFAQHQLEQLDSQASPLLHLQRIDQKATEKDLRNFLGGFGFQADMAITPVSTYSGGEKARLVLALIVYQKPNLLLLDEPTNHLDLDMRHALSLALQEFAGAMVIVSHDRHLLRTVADTLFLVADGKLSPFDGDMDDYQRLVKEKNENKAADDKQNIESSTNVSKKQIRQDAADLRRQLQPLRNKIKSLETKMDKLHLASQTIEQQLTDNTLYEPHNKSKLTAMLAEKTDLDKQRQLNEQQWLDVSEQLEKLMRQSEN